VVIGADGVLTGSARIAAASDERAAAQGLILESEELAGALRRRKETPRRKVSGGPPIRVALLHRRSLDSKRARLFTTEAGAARGGRQAVAALALAPLARFVTSLASSAT
jgi:hypothetical protein